MMNDSAPKHERYKLVKYAPLKMVKSKSWGRKIVKDIQKSKKELKEKTVK